MTEDIMPKKHKVVNKIVVHNMHKIETWDDLIALAKRNILRAKIRQDELAAALRLYEQKRDAGIPLTEGERTS
jgi:hypothetical protein